MALAQQSPSMTAPRRRVLVDERGFSLAEILTIVAIIAVLFGITIIAFQAAATTIQGDSNLRILEGQLKYARDIAVSERRSVQVVLTAPTVDGNTLAMIQVIRQDRPSGTTLLSSAMLENNTTFVDFDTVPDTPESFGASSVYAPGGGTPYLFTPDSMFTDQAGSPVNATIFIGQAGKVVTARAVTVFGTTARIRTYRWNGSQWGH
jgi:Tfp pilus assembly protein FimT